MREKDDKTSRTDRFYLLSKKTTAQEAASLIRGHWQNVRTEHDGLYLPL